MSKEKKEELTEEQKESKKIASTAFLLFFPSLIVAVLGIIATKSIWQAAIIIALVVYQFLMLKKFIEDFYKR